MAQKRSSMISAEPAVGRVLGAQIQRDGIQFSAAVPPGKEICLILYRKGSDEIAKEIPFPNQQGTGIVRTMKVKGISPKQYEYNFRIDDEVVTDPAARLVYGRTLFGDFAPRTEHQVRGGFLTAEFAWGDQEQKPNIPYEDVIAYQLHVRGFTKQKNSGVRHKGTFLGLQEKIPYLRELGVNQVILLPACEFDEVVDELGIGARLPLGNRYANAVDRMSGKKLNYWGYIQGFSYAPKRSYCATDKPDIEFKNMVKTFHENGMEVVMEFCFPDPVDIAFAADCLIWWLQEYHVDGFYLRMNQAAANALAGNPFLTGCKLISEYFPVGQIYREGMLPAMRCLAECNDGFKVTARKLLKGDEDQLAQFVSRNRCNPSASAVMNHITGHDGFTLMDLVSYDKKHNEENGEQGRDGAACDFSWNCGNEGPTKKRQIARLRMQQMKNAFAMVLLAQGTPLLLAGDEFGNSQGGNNNPYCIDSEVSWVDWSKARSNRELTDFVRTLIRIRKEHRILHMPRELTGGDFRALGYPDVSYHGSRAWYGSFDYSSRHVGIMYCGMYADQEEFIYAAYNFHWNCQKMALPDLPETMEWRRILDTSESGSSKSRSSVAGSGDENHEDVVTEREFDIPPRCVQVLVGRARPEPNGGTKRRIRKTKQV